MNVFQLSCFLAVADNLSFARAAAGLHITQPAVTQQIRALEKELGVRLFVRTTRTVGLTEEGRSFYGDARRIVEISEQAKKRFEKPSEVEIVRLSIGCGNTPALFLLSAALEKLAHEYPSLHPSLQVVPPLQIYRVFSEGGLDAVISFRESSSMRIPAAYKELAKVPLVCLCGAGHKFSSRKSVTLDELKNEKLVLFAQSRTSPVVAEIQSRLMGGRAPSEFHFCDTGEAAVVLAGAGFGVSVIPDLYLPERLPAAKIPITGAAPVSFGVYHKPFQNNKLLKTFVQRLKENFPPAAAYCG